MTEYHSYILTRTPELGDDEAAFMARVYDRVLVTGRRSYKEWIAAIEKRDMVNEAVDELLDGCVYLAMALVMRSESRARRVAAFAEAHTDALFDFSDEPTTEWRVNKLGKDCPDCGALADGVHAQTCPWTTKVPQ